MIRPESLPLEIKQETEKTDRDGVSTCFLDMTSETGVPTVVAIIKSIRPGEPRYSMGAGCNFDLRRALRRAWEEAWSTYYWSRRNFDKFSVIPENYEPFITKIDVTKRISTWSGCEMEGKLDFFLQGEKTDFLDLEKKYARNFPDKKKELSALIDSVSKIEKNPQIIIHTSPNKVLKDVNYFSVRVIIPALLPMYYREENAPINHPRIKHRENVNPLLHLFP